MKSPVENAHPAISYVMPAYNCAEFVAESVESIFSGNFQKEDELIIVNDASTDTTPDVLQSLQAGYPFIRVIHNRRNIGCSASRNVGIDAARNALIFNLDSDNVLVPGSVSQLTNYLLQEKADIAAFGELHFFIGRTSNVTHKWIFNPGVMTLADFLAGHYNPGPSGNYLYTKASWQRAGKYYEFGPGLNEAWGFTLKELANGAKLVALAGAYYLHRYGHSSLYVRETTIPGASTLMATRMIEPFLPLLIEEDAAYITSTEGGRNWFDNLNQRPIRLRSGAVGKTGRCIHLSLPASNPAQVGHARGIFSRIERFVMAGILAVLPGSLSQPLRTWLRFRNEFNRLHDGDGK